MSTTDLAEGLESLDYWRSRRQRLAWYRFGARREAAEMTARWEGRVRAALFSERGASLRLRASAAMTLIGVGLRTGRRRSRLFLKFVGVSILALLALPILATAALLAQIF